MTVLHAHPPAVQSLVPRPTIVGHRGASGHRPEHTLGAYRQAIRMGAAEIEVDVVSTRDGVLVARHEPELSLTTDVASRPELADRLTTRTIDRLPATGWFAQDLTLAEVKHLTARERLPGSRPGSAAHDGADGVATLTEVLAMVAAESRRRGRPVGVLIELKHAAHHDRIGLPLDVALLACLRRHGLDHPWSGVSVMAFEADILRRLASRTRLPLIQLLEAGDGDRCTPQGLLEIDEYADGIGPHKSLVLPRNDAGEIDRPSTLVRDAHRLGLTVLAWTLRVENRYLPANLRLGGDPNGPGDMVAEAAALLAAGVDGIITDHPDVALRVRCR